MARSGYARVSTRSQRDDSQLDALNAAGCERIWVDKASGKLAKRPEWDKCLGYLRRGDELVITRLSHVFWSVRHLTELAAVLDERGIELIVLDQGIDTTTPGWPDPVPRHQRDGRDARRPDQRGHPGVCARARGRVGGRKPKRIALQVAKAREMYEENGPDGKRKHTVAEIAEVLGASRKTIYRHLEPDGGWRQPDKSVRLASVATPARNNGAESSGNEDDLAGLRPVRARI